MTMTIGDLKKAIADLPDEELVVLQKDGEGNAYSPLEGIDPVIYVADSTYSGEVYLRELTDEDRENGYDESDLYDGDDGQLAIALYSVN